VGRSHDPKDLALEVQVAHHPREQAMWRVGSRGLEFSVCRMSVLVAMNWTYRGRARRAVASHHSASYGATATTRWDNPLPHHDPGPPSESDFGYDDYGPPPGPPAGDGDNYYSRWAAVPSFLAAVLTEIYLCNVCSCQEILRRNGRGQPPPLRGGGDVWLLHWIVAKVVVSTFVHALAASNRAASAMI
jgi:hypothetical protein